MRRIARLALGELGRFKRGRLRPAALVVLLLVPLLYAGLYLWAFWKPYARMDNMPVALVNNDRAVKVNGSRVAAGDQLASRLRRRGTFEWHTVSADEAGQGLGAGRYYATLTIPRGFSASLASIQADNPRAARIRVRVNEATNYLAGQLTRPVFREVRASAAATFSRRYFNELFVKIDTAHDKAQHAAKSGSRLAKGAGDANDGAHQLASGLDDAESASGQLVQGAGRLASASGELESGAGRLRGGAARLEQGTSRLAAGARSLDSGLDVLEARTSDLPAQTRRLARGSRQVAQGTGRVADRVGQVADVVGAATRDAQQRQVRLRRILRRENVPRDVRQEILAGSQQGVAKLQRANERVEHKASAARRLARAADHVASGNRRLAHQTPALVSSIERSSSAAGDLAAGARSAHGGAADLAGGTVRLADSAAALNEATQRVSAASGQLNQGIGSLESGAGQVDSGLDRVDKGSHQLADRLHQAADRIPAMGKHERNRRADVGGKPVRLASAAVNGVPNYGSGFTPYFLPLALWIGALLSYLLLRPLNRRAIVAGAPAWVISLGGYLPGATLAVGQTVVALAVLRGVLGLYAIHPWALWGFALLAGLTYAAILQALSAVFGTVGRVLAIVALILQLSTSAGTYPIETAPGPLQAIHPYLPMTYMVNGLRQAISGDLTKVGIAAIILGGWMVAALVATTFAARRDRTLTFRKVRPELEVGAD